MTDQITEREMRAMAVENSNLSGALRAAESERDTAREIAAETSRIMEERDEARNLLADRVVDHRQAESERDAARADAERLAKLLEKAINKTAWLDLDSVSAALAAHRAQKGNPVLPPLDHAENEARRQESEYSHSDDAH